MLLRDDPELGAALPHRDAGLERAAVIRCDEGALASLRRTVDAQVPVVGFSARTGEGKDVLWRLVRGWLAAPERAARGL